MSYFECCRFCEAPKRYPGCSGKCEEYKAERRRYDADMTKKPGKHPADDYYNERIANVKNHIAREKKRRPRKIYYRGGDCV